MLVHNDSPPSHQSHDKKGQELTSPQTPAPSPFFFSSFTTPTFQAWVQEMRAQAAQTTRNLTPKDYIRLLAIVGGYCLLRPYLVKFGGRFQASDHEREIHDADILPGGGKGIISPNVIRGQIPEDTDEEDEEEEGDKGVVSWGRKARRRQRGLVRKIVAAEEKRRREEDEADSDKEIEEFLRGAID